MKRSIVFTSVAALALSACGGGHGGSSLPPASPTVSATKAPQSGKTAATLTITVPHPSTTSTARRPAYVSPSSSQLVVAVTQGKTNEGTATYGLSATSPGCATAEGNLQCSFQVPAAVGTDSFSLTLEDAAGAVLSENTISAAIAAGVVTPVNVTLAGIPSSVIVAPGLNSGIEDTTTQPYHVPGLLPQPVELEALDADGNIIIGPGAPTFGTPQLTGATNATIVSAGTNDPNAYILKPTGPAGGETATVSVSTNPITLNSGTPSPSVTGSAKFLFTPAIALASGPFLFEYSLETGKLIGLFNACPGTCGTSVAGGIATDTNGDIWVTVNLYTGGTSHIVGEFKAGSTTSSNVLSGTTGTGEGIAIGATGMVYNANAAGGSFRSRTPASITEYAAGSTTPEYTIASTTYLTMPAGIAVDSNGYVYVSNSAGAGDVGNGNVVVFAPGGSSTPIATYSDPNLVNPGPVAVDASGDVFVYDSANEDVAYFAAAGTPPTNQTAMTQAIYGGPFVTVDSLAFDSSGDILVDGNGEFEVIPSGNIFTSQTPSLSIGATGFAAVIP